MLGVVVFGPHLLDDRADVPLRWRLESALPCAAMRWSNSSGNDVPSRLHRWMSPNSVHAKLAPSVRCSVSFHTLVRRYSARRSHFVLVPPVGELAVRVRGEVLEPHAGVSTGWSVLLAPALRVVREVEVWEVPLPLLRAVLLRHRELCLVLVRDIRKVKGRCDARLAHRAHEHLVWGHPHSRRHLPLRSAAHHDRLPAGFQIGEQGGIFLHRFEQPSLELRESPRLVFTSGVSLGFLPSTRMITTLARWWIVPISIPGRSPLRSRISWAALRVKVTKAISSGRAIPGSHRIAGLRDHRVRLAGPSAGDDEGAVFLDDDRPPLVLVQIGECRVCEPIPEQPLVRGPAARLARPLAASGRAATP